MSNLEQLGPPSPAPPELLQVPGGLPDMNARVAEFFDSPKAEGALRLRVVCNLYDPARAHYTSWPSVCWGLRFYSVEQATRFREGLDDFVREWVKVAGDQTEAPVDTPSPAVPE